MKARLCDICGKRITFGKLYRNDKPAMTVKVKQKNNYERYDKLELCNSCMANMIYYCQKHRGDADD